jgi:conjugative relaxase-like TrwC/TraI family protein
VLSIGKLATGQAGYYLEQAHGSVTRATAVSSGVEDYYLGGPEASGEWVGAGGVALGLRGTVNATELDRVLCGRHPATGEALGRVLTARVPGFDLTFSAPKSVSVLFGIGDDELRAVLRDAHDRAVIDALGYMEREAAVTRRGPGGVHAIAGTGLIAAAFRHRTSRAGDPQLHTHVLVANLALGADGQWSTLDGRRIYAHAKTAGYLYEARLRSLLTRELGVDWTPVRNGIADIAGVQPTVLRGFSRRRADIEAELERRGATSAAAAQIAALQTRRGKDYGVTPEQLVPEWRARARELGLDPERLSVLGRQVPPLEPDSVLEQSIADWMVGPAGLTHRCSTFTRRDVIQAVCERLPAGVPASVADIERIADRFLTSDRAVALAVGERRPVRDGALRRRDGRVVVTLPSERVYSTPELLSLEQRIIRHARETQHARVGIARPRAIERAIAARPTMAGEQTVMVRRLTEDGAGVAVVVGEAGTGKTFALGAAREAWEASGRRVIGVAIARRAARELELDAGISSTSVAALLEQLRRRPVSAIPLRAVLVVDEAGMVSTRQLAALVDHAAARRAKLVLVGDHRQLPELEAGGAFRALTARLPAIELHENRRQIEGWERSALALLRDGSVEQALQRYQDRGRVVVKDDAADLRRQLVADWWAARDPEGAVMIAYRRTDVVDLNGRARALMCAAGALGESELRLPIGSFAVGDRVVVRRNDLRLTVANGDRGTVLDVDPAAGSLDVDIGGRHVRLDSAYLARSNQRNGPSLAHGYAITCHSAQGMTCREAFVLALGPVSREWGYTALSRGREANRLYAIVDEPDERAEYAPAGQSRDTRRDLAGAFSRSAAQTLASDFGRDQQAREELLAVTAEREAAERSHQRAVAMRAELEGGRPPRLRFHAHTRHRDALATAREAEATVESRVHALRAREAELREEIQRSHAAHERTPDRGVLERAVPAQSRGLEVGR